MQKNITIYVKSKRYVYTHKDMFSLSNIYPEKLTMLTL